MSGYGQMQYKKTQVTTVDKGRLIVLLYEGATKFIRQAMDCAQANDLAGKSNYINRAMDVVAELNHSLNLKEGGEVAENLRKLYLFMSDQLLKAKIETDTKASENVIQILETLGSAWNEVVTKPEAQEAVPKVEASSLRPTIKV